VGDRVRRIGAHPAGAHLMGGERGLVVGSQRSALDFGQERVEVIALAPHDWLLVEGDDLPRLDGEAQPPTANEGSTEACSERHCRSAWSDPSITRLRNSVRSLTCGKGCCGTGTSRNSHSRSHPSFTSQTSRRSEGTLSSTSRLWRIIVSISCCGSACPEANVPSPSHTSLSIISKKPRHCGLTCACALDSSLTSDSPWRPAHTVSRMLPSHACGSRTLSRTLASG